MPEIPKKRLIFTIVRNKHVRPHATPHISNARQMDNEWEVAEDSFRIKTCDGSEQRNANTFEIANKNLT